MFSFKCFLSVILIDIFYMLVWPYVADFILLPPPRQRLIIIFHILYLNILQTYFLGKGLSKASKTYWENVCFKSWGCFRKKVYYEPHFGIFWKKKSNVKDFNSPNNISHEFHSSSLTWWKPRLVFFYYKYS